MPKPLAFHPRNPFPTENPLNSEKSYNSHLPYLGSLEITLLIYTPLYRKLQSHFLKIGFTLEFILLEVGGSTSDAPFCEIPPKSSVKSTAILLKRNDPLMSPEQFAVSMRSGAFRVICHFSEVRPDFATRVRKSLLIGNGGSMGRLANRGEFPTWVIYSSPNGRYT